jgi:putative transposase
MSAQRFSSGKCFHWQDTTYEVRRLLPGGRLRIEDVLTEDAVVVELPTLVEALFDGKLRFAIEGQHTTPDANDHAGIESQYIDLVDCPEHLVTIARRRLEVIQPLLEMKPEERTREAVEMRVREIRETTLEAENCGLQDSVSVASIYRWIRDYTQSGNDLRALIPATGERGGKGTSRLSDEVEAIVESTIHDKYYVREAATIDDVVYEIAVRLEEENRSRAAHERLKAPSRRTVARRINALDMRSRFAARHGTRAAKREFSQYGDTEYPQIPLERVEIDHTLIDLIVIDDQDNLPLGRLTLTYCLDMATRYPLGYYMGFEPPSYLTVMECLHHAIRPKESTGEKYGTKHEWIAYGIPSTLVIDNGKEFIGQDLQDACLLLGIVIQQTPVKTPHFKAGVERLFGSLNTMLFHTLPGTTFSDPRKRGDYDSVKQACVYLSEIDRIMNIFIVDIYAQRFHRGIEGIPARRWEAAMRSGFWPRVPPNAEELAILLGRVSHRAVQHYGVRFQSLRYNSSELTTLRTRLRGEKVKVKYHPADLSRLYVYDLFDNRYIEVPALDQEYTRGLSLWKHRIIRRAARDEYGSVDLVALGRAKRKIQEIVEAGRSRKRVGTRSRIARWDTAGKPTREIADGSGSKTDEGGEDVPALEPISSVRHASQPAKTGWPDLSAVEEASDDGWEITYDLPRTRRDLPTTTDQEVGDVEVN